MNTNYQIDALFYAAFKKASNNTLDSTIVTTIPQPYINPLNDKLAQDLIKLIIAHPHCIEEYKMEQRIKSAYLDELIKRLEERKLNSNG